MSVLIQPQLLLFPPLYIETSRKSDIVQNTTERRDGGFEVVLDKSADISNCSHIILALFLPTQTVEGFHVLLRNLLFAILALHFQFIVRVEIPARGVFAVIEDGGESAGEVEGGPERLFFCKILEKIELAHLYRWIIKLYNLQALSIFPLFDVNTAIKIIFIIYSS